jgi:hypothetical protein
MRPSPAVVNTSATPVNEHPSLSPTNDRNHLPHLHPPRSPAASIHSRSSVTDHSEFDTLDPNDPTARGQASAEKEKRRHRWRFSSSAKKTDDFPLAPPPRIGENSGAQGSNSSLGSGPGKAPRKSFTGDSQATTVRSELDGSTLAQGQSGMHQHSSQESEALRDVTNNGDEKRGGLFGKWKAKRSERKEEKKEREMEKERAKSPPRSPEGDGKPRTSLSAFAHDHFGGGPGGRRSFDRSRGSSAASQGAPPLQPTQGGEGVGGLETVKERPVTEAREKDMSGTPPQGQVQMQNQRAQLPVPPLPSEKEAEVAAVEGTNVSPNAVVPESAKEGTASEQQVAPASAPQSS